MAVIGALALMLFGPEQLPKVAKRFGHVMRDMQNTSQAFIRELERAADEYEPSEAHDVVDRDMEREVARNSARSGPSDVEV